MLDEKIILNKSVVEDNSKIQHWLYSNEYYSFEYKYDKEFEIVHYSQVYKKSKNLPDIIFLLDSNFNIDSIKIIKNQNILQSNYYQIAVNTVRQLTKVLM